VSDAVANIGWTGVYAAALGATGTLLGVWLREYFRRSAEHDTTDISARAAVYGGFGNLVQVQQNEIAALRADRDSIWKKIGELQNSVEECEILRREDNAKHYAETSALNAENAEQARRIRVLEQKLSTLNLDNKDKMID
jgi:hypothetical protein